MRSSDRRRTCRRTRVAPRLQGYAALVLIGAALAGCQAQPGPAGRGRADRVEQPDAPQQAQSPDARTPAGPSINTDPCATRMHDLCGPLLLYYLTNRRLPERLEELSTMLGADGTAPIACPVSNRPYVYNPDGLLMPETRSRVVIYDPAPSHYGIRWGVSIVEPQEPTGALVAKVIALPESTFRFQQAK